MALKEKIEADLKQAMRAQDAIARETLRMILAALKNKRIELGHDLEPADELGVLQKAHKTRMESAEQFAAAGRAELAEKERKEAALVETYLPKLLGEDETRALVAAVVAELGATDKKQVGQVMKAVMARHKGEVDGKVVQRVAAELLS